VAAIANQFALAARDLHDCKAKGLSDDWRFNIAYNAALQLANAALNAAGFDVGKGESGHFRAIHSLEFTIGSTAAEVRQLDGFRKKRSQSVYDAAGVVSPTEVKEMIELATALLSRVGQWVRSNHRSLSAAVPPTPPCT
jgi:hypothetical protein